MRIRNPGFNADLVGYEMVFMQDPEPKLPFQSRIRSRKKYHSGYTTLLRMKDGSGQTRMAETKWNPDPE
jgi:hypothetical protein